MNTNLQISSLLEENISLLKENFPIAESFDYITREFSIQSKKAVFLGINGFCDSTLLQRLFSDLQNPLFFNHTDFSSLPLFISQNINYIQVSIINTFDQVKKQVLSGPSILFIDGFSCALVIDTRSYPTRSIQEPEMEKVMKGSKDGFVETMLTNTNLIRRRIRSHHLIFSLSEVGTDSKTDVSIAYMKNLADPNLVQFINHLLKSLNISALTMGIQSLIGLLLKKNWLHPLPNFFLTSRPDVACSYLLEGYILLFVDNSPLAVVLPCNIFQFTQSPEDYYKSPLVGTYFRFIRFVCIIITLLLMPTFLLLGSNPQWLPDNIQIIAEDFYHPIALFVFVLFIEIGLDLFQYACSHTSNGLSGSLAIVGGLIIGEVAISLNWVSTEVLFYGAVTLLATLLIPSFEFGEALRLYRLFIVLFTGFFGLYGYIAGIALVLLSIVTTPSLGGKGYFWPLYPFQKKALKTLILRYPTSASQPPKNWNKNSE